MPILEHIIGRHNQAPLLSPSPSPGDSQSIDACTLIFTPLSVVGAGLRRKRHRSAHNTHAQRAHNTTMPPPLGAPYSEPRAVLGSAHPSSCMGTVPSARRTSDRSL